jgi:hypothetical protein
MKANEFDKAIRHSYDQGDFEYNPAHWEEMVQQLNEAESKKPSIAWLPLISYAASITLMVSIGAFLMRGNAPQDKLVASEGWTEHSMIFSQPSLPQQEPGSQAEPRPFAGAATPVAGTKKVVNMPQQVPVPEVAGNIAVIIPNDAQNVLKASAAMVAAPVPHVAQKAPAYIDLSGPVYEPMGDGRTGKTIISVTGGLNYGSANSGYAIGFTAYQKLADNLFFEGDIAFVNNVSGKKTELTTEGSYAAAAAASQSLGGSNSGTLGGSNRTAARPSGAGADASSTNAAKPSSISPTDPAIPANNIVTPAQPQGNHYNLFYAQVTPTLGYNVFKNLSLSGGADVQRLLQDEKLMTITAHEADAKYVPAYDFGFVGKTEYAISRELKATVYYRHGLNNAISGGAAEKYIDRNYIQLQLKFSILNK